MNPDQTKQTQGNRGRILLTDGWIVRKYCVINGCGISLVDEHPSSFSHNTRCSKRMDQMVKLILLQWITSITWIIRLLEVKHSVPIINTVREFYRNNYPKNASLTYPLTQIHDERLLDSHSVQHYSPVPNLPSILTICCRPLVAQSTGYESHAVLARTVWV